MLAVIPHALNVTRNSPRFNKCRSLINRKTKSRYPSAITLDILQPVVLLLAVPCCRT